MSIEDGSNTEKARNPMEILWENPDHQIESLEDFMLGMQILHNYGPMGELGKMKKGLDEVRKAQLEGQLNNLTERMKAGLAKLGGRKAVDELIKEDGSYMFLYQYELEDGSWLK